MTSFRQKSAINVVDNSHMENNPEQTQQLCCPVLARRGNISKILLLLLLLVAPLSCSGGQNIEDQVVAFLTSVQSLDIDKCVEMSSLYQTRLMAIQNEPQFKIDNLLAEISVEIRRTMLNQYDNDNIIYLFKFPCQWQILETKKLSQETNNGVFSGIAEYYRVYVLVKYNSIDKSPISIPLISKDCKSQYNIKEIILHCDFDSDTRLYLGWGLDNHTRW